MIYDTLAYVSGHALARMHQRTARSGIDFEYAGAALAQLGIVSYLVRNSVGTDCGLSLLFDDILIVGTMRPIAIRDRNEPYNGVLFDVRTALLADEVRDEALLAQGRAAYRAVTTWLAGAVDDSALAEQIPLLPARDDYTSRNGTRVTRS